MSRKRTRTEEVAGGTGERRIMQSEESTKRFHAYINAWRSSVAAPHTVLPSGLPPLAPVQSVLDIWRDAANASHRHDHPLAVESHATGTGVAYDEVMTQHRSVDPQDYERPARLERTLEHLTAVGLLQRCERIRSRPAKTRELRRVHSRDHVDYVDQLDFFMSLKTDSACSVGQDLYACPYTSKAARFSAGCAVAAAQAVVRGDVRNAYAIIRPPGHHAGVDVAAGFCFFNNVAVAARAAQEEVILMGREKPRVLVLDWDVHHCDGTETIFYNDPSVLVISIHQYGSGKGHYLRKPPSLPVKDDAVIAADAELSAEALAALLEDEPVPAPAVAAVEVEQPLNEPERSDRRARKEVDYNKLAAELSVDDSDAMALFGIHENSAALSDSSASTSSCSSASSAGSAPRTAVKHAGDTDGVSFDDERSSQGSADAFYPGTGHAERVGGEDVDAARGTNINIPWPTHHFGDIEYLQVLTELVIPVAQEFAPEVVIISCGFDSAQGDLLGSMNLTPSGYYLMTKLLCKHFSKVVVVLEGGYHVANVAKCSETVLRALLEVSAEAAAQPLPFTRMLYAQAQRLVARVKHQHSEYWRCYRSDSQ